MREKEGTKIIDFDVIEMEEAAEKEIRRKAQATLECGKENDELTRLWLGRHLVTGIHQQTMALSLGRTPLSKKAGGLHASLLILRSRLPWRKWGG